MVSKVGGGRGPVIIREARSHVEEEEEREASPAQSQASGGAALEWDPSADVGSQVPSNTPIHYPSTRETVSSRGAAALDQILVAFNRGFDLEPYVAESRSQRFGSDCDRLSCSSGSSSFKTATEETGFEGEEMSGNPGASFSNWQTSGLTRSEIEFMSRRQGSGSSTRSSSMLWVEVHAEGNESTNKRTTESGSSSKSSRKTSDSENNTDGGSRNSKTSSRGRSGGRRTSSSSDSVDNQTGPSRESMPQKNVAVQVNVRKEATSSKRHHHAPHGRHETLKSHRHFCSNICHCCAAASSFRNLNLLNAGSSSESDAAATCAALEELVKSEKGISGHHQAYHALEHHRNSLIRKMRREFMHLEKLNSLLLTKKDSRVVSEHSKSDASGSNNLKPEARHRSVPSISVGTHADTSNGNNNNNRESSNSEKDLNKNVIVPSRGDTMKLFTSHSNMRAPSHPTFKPPVPPPPSTKKTNDVCNVPPRKPVTFFVPLQAPPRLPRKRTKGSDIDYSEQDTLSGWHAHHGGGERTKFDTPKENSPDEDDSITNASSVLPDMPVTLKDAFEQYCPRVKAHVEHREMLLRRIKMNREVSAEVKRDYFRQRNILSPNDSLNQALPPDEPRLMSYREMRTLTEKKNKKLPENQAKLARRRQEDDKRTNRLLSQVFSRKLKQLVLNGDVNIVHPKSLIRS